MNFFPSLPPPPPPLSTTFNGAVDQLLTQPQPQLSNSNINPDVIPATSSSPLSSSTSSPSSSFITITIVISSAIILSATIYFILRFISRRLHHDSTPPPSSGVAREKTQLDSLPSFKFGSVNGKLTRGGGGDCAVCLSKFDSDDQLRLLPLCCHVFHARCIDTWLSHNQTCPLCRSTVYSATSEALNKLPSISRQNHNSNNTNNDSYRVEIGSVSRRRQPPTHTTTTEDDGGRRRSYSIGSFEYIVDENLEIPVDVTSAEKEFGGGVVVAPPGESLAAAEYGGSGRNWLKEYVERLGSFAISSSSSSFRGSGRVVMGSSRRNDVVVPIDDDDLEANSRVGEEISELFRWISGV